MKSFEIIEVTNLDWNLFANWLPAKFKITKIVSTVEDFLVNQRFYLFLAVKTGTTTTYLFIYLFDIEKSWFIGLTNVFIYV